MVLPKYAASKDVNENEIVVALKAIGCQVESIGRPVDLLVGYKGFNYLIEVKQENTYYKGTEEQRDWIKGWKGQVRVCSTPEEAISLVTNAYRGDTRNHE